MPQEESQILVVIVIGIVMLLIFAVAIVVFLLAFQKRKFSHLKEKQELENTFQFALLKSSLEIQETTQKMLGQELHDNIGQILAVVRLHLENLQDNLEGENKESAAVASELLRKAMKDVRAFSHSLNADQVRRKGLSGALRELAGQIQQSGKLACKFQDSGNARSIDPAHVVILYRMCQELVNNALRHSEAANLHIDLNWKENRLEIQIQDDGKGMQMASSNRQLSGSGQGLENIQSRAQVLGADFKLKAPKEAGTIATISYPFAQHSHQQKQK